MSNLNLNEKEFDFIRFTHNWNNKLNNQYFTTIRLQNKNRYKIGKIFIVEMNKNQLKLVKVSSVDHLKAGQLKELICRLDTGLSKEETLKLLNKMYQSVDVKNLDISLILFETIKLSEIYKESLNQSKLEM